MVCPHGHGGKDEPVRTFFEQGRKGLIFLDFMRMSFLDVPCNPTTRALFNCTLGIYKQTNISVQTRVVNGPRF